MKDPVLSVSSGVMFVVMSILDYVINILLALCIQLFMDNVTCNVRDEYH